MKKVLFAHQSCIPHYRIPFYNSLKKNKPGWWDFDVIDVKSKEDHKSDIHFDITKTKLYSLNLFGQEFKYQAFLSKINNYELLIVEDAVNNLSYPLSHIIKSSATKISYWGHGRDVTIGDGAGILKNSIERYKLRQIKKAAGYFAYMPAVKEYLINKGVSSDKIFTIYNTIDIDKERAIYNELNKLSNEKIRNVLFVGRLTESKKIQFLLKIFESLNEINKDYKFTIVGDGDIKYHNMIKEKSKSLNINLLGEITDKATLAGIFKDHSFYVFPGYVGLGPLHAMCYDLIPVIKESKYHKPEIEYLNQDNSLILPKNSTPVNFAHQIEKLVNNKSYYLNKREKVWPSIKIFTIDNMANNFIAGINEILRPKY